LRLTTDTCELYVHSKPQYLLSHLITKCNQRELQQKNK